MLPATTSQAAHVRVTRVEPEVFVPPLPGRPVLRAAGVDREEQVPEVREPRRRSRLGTGGGDERGDREGGSRLEPAASSRAERAEAAG